jgi:hypothetical protein
MSKCFPLWPPAPSASRRDAAMHNSSLLMSAVGQKQTSRPAWTMSALPPKADIEPHDGHVRFVPKADKRAAAKVPLFDHRAGTGEQLPKWMLSEFAVVP